MDLLSVFKRNTPPAPGQAAETADAVQLARTRARQRLIGAAVLVVAGIIAFPLLFETQPRPIPVDLPIEIPRKENAPPLAMPSPPPAAPAATPPTAAKPAASAGRVITETAADAGVEVAPAASAGVAAPASAATPAEPPAKAKAPPAPVPKASAPPPTAAAADGARAQALLDGSPVSAPAATASTAGAARYVVQVGAFSDPVALKDARAKVEKLGLKTYTQVAETPAGPRTRVRVGPFETRAEAERAAAKIKAGAMPAAILSL